MKVPLLLLATTILAVAAVAAEPPPPTKAQLDFFEAKVRPVLAANCYKCHSAAEGKAKGELLLDTRDGWLKGGEHGATLVPGDPAKSLLVKAISYADADLQMPPNGKKLSAQQVADLTAWVQMGAPDPRTAPAGTKLTGLTDKAKSHWAYQPVQDPPVPTVQNAKWVKTPVDNFVLAKLESAGMQPCHPAAREALIRRATYDLTGLPPTPEEVRAFANDPSPTAFEKVVDRLLASPAYGERWGRHWLDSARYSDTTGIEKNNRGGDYRYAHAWTYRDYVIGAFNADKPYDVFLKEQLAADLLPSARTDPASLAALGFVTVGKRFQNPNDVIDERIDTLTKATQALTVACARCHDHKFDPIPTADYYSLHGVFNSLVEPADLPLVGPSPGGSEYEDFKRKLAAMEARNRDAYYTVAAAQSAEFQRKASAYLQVGLVGRRGPGGGGSGGADALKARNALIAEHNLDRNVFQGLRLQPRRDDGLFAPLFMAAQIPPDELAGRAREFLGRVAGGALGRGGPRAVRINPYVVAAFREVKPEQIRTLADVADVYGKLFASLADQRAAYVKACRAATTSDKVAGFDDAALVDLLEFPVRLYPASKLDTEGMKAAVADLKLQNGGFQRFPVFGQINELMLTHPGAPARAMVVADADRPRDSQIFVRGEAQNRGKLVPRQYLEIVAGKDRKPFTQGAGRLELAEAIASRNNPLTARVAVNRVWMHHFGEGIVRTVDDLGVMCDPPSHPELLDYLASRFVEGGWSFKKLHKLILLSAAYGQSSDTNPAFASKDPENRLLWRANLRRLDFEAVRDTMLQYTGRLDRTLGGKPVNLTDEPYSYRRSVYGYVDRGQMPELMQQFDFPDADMANSKRTSTIVPQQALFFMNSPMSADVARKVTTRPEFTAAKDDMGRVRALYEVLFQRPPKGAEVAAARDFIVAAEAARPQVASVKATRGAAARPPRGAENRPGVRSQKSAIKNAGEMVERRPLTAWEQYAQALLMSNEIVYVN